MANAETTARKWYEKGLWDKAKLRNLVVAGKLTAEAYERITGEPYETEEA